MKRQRVRLIIASISLLAILFAVALLMLRNAAVSAAIGHKEQDVAAPPKFYWDFSHDRKISVVGWPADLRGDQWFQEGIREVKVVMPDGKEITFTSGKCTVIREGDEVRVITFHSFPMKRDSAVLEAKRLLLACGVSGDEALQAWIEKRRRDENGDRDPAGPNVDMNDTSKGFPRLGVSIRTTFSDVVPWCVQWGAVFAAPQERWKRPKGSPLPEDGGRSR